MEKGLKREANGRKDEAEGSEFSGELRREEAWTEGGREKVKKKPKDEGQEVGVGEWDQKKEEKEREGGKNGRGKKRGSFKSLTGQSKLVQTGLTRSIEDVYLSLWLIIYNRSRTNINFLSEQNRGNGRLMALHAREVLIYMCIYVREAEHGRNSPWIDNHDVTHAFIINEATQSLLIYNWAIMRPVLTINIG